MKHFEKNYSLLTALSHYKEHIVKLSALHSFLIFCLFLTDRWDQSFIFGFDYWIRLLVQGGKFKLSNFHSSCI